VRIADRVAGLGIRLAGLGTIGAVSLVCVFLVAVAAPLFRSQRLERSGDLAWSPRAGDLAWSPRSGDPLAEPPISAPVSMGVDDSGAIGWAYGGDDRIRVFELGGGTTLA
jgi:hypothetical protein